MAPFTTFIWNSFRTLFTRLPSEANAPTVPYNISQIGSYQWQPNGDWQRARWDGENWVPEPGINAPDDLKPQLDRARQNLLDRDASQRKALEGELNRIFPYSWPNNPLSPSQLPGIDNQCNRDFNAARNLVIRRDPLVLDLDGDGLELLPASGAFVFDHNADGIKTGTGWVHPNDGFLVRDLNGNGAIDTGRELFGEDTLKNNGALAANGFDALRELDTNNDRQITHADTAFAELKVWRDLDQNGVSSANELLTLDQLGITSINTNGTSAGPQAGQLINNNRVALGTNFTQDGQTKTVGAIDLEANNFFTEFPPQVVDHTGTPIAITTQAQGLLQMNGAGMVRDRRAAASLDGASAAALARKERPAYVICRFKNRCKSSLRLRTFPLIN